MSEQPTATVFGGTGFLGHAVVQALAKRGYLVRVPSRNPGKALDLKLMGATGQITTFRASVRTDAAVAAALAGSQVVVNLIGILAETKQMSFQTAHVETAARIARLARAEGAEHLIHISALGASMDAKARYARTKAVGEEAVRAFFSSAVILRPSIMFGPRDNFLNRFARLSRFSPVLPLIGGGSTRFQPVYVGDVANTVLAAIDKKAAQGRTFDLGGPKIYSFRELMDLVLRLTDRKRLLLSLPWSLASFLGRWMELLPTPPLTRDQVELLKTDNVVGARTTALQAKARGVGTMSDLGITPTPLEAIVAEYLSY